MGHQSDTFLSCSQKTGSLKTIIDFSFITAVQDIVVQKPAKTILGFSDYFVLLIYLMLPRSCISGQRTSR